MLSYSNLHIKPKIINLLNMYNVWIKENDMEPKVYIVLYMYM